MVAPDSLLALDSPHSIGTATNHRNTTAPIRHPAWFSAVLSCSATDVVAAAGSSGRRCLRFLPPGQCLRRPEPCPIQGEARSAVASTSAASSRQSQKHSQSRKASPSADAWMPGRSNSLACDCEHSNLFTKARQGSQTAKTRHVVATHQAACSICVAATRTGGSPRSTARFVQGGVGCHETSRRQDRPSFHWCFILDRRCPSIGQPGGVELLGAEVH